MKKLCSCRRSTAMVKLENNVKHLIKRNIFYVFHWIFNYTIHQQLRVCMLLPTIIIISTEYQQVLDWLARKSIHLGKCHRINTIRIQCLGQGHQTVNTPLERYIYLFIYFFMMPDLHFMKGECVFLLLLKQYIANICC